MNVDFALKLEKRAGECPPEGKPGVQRFGRKYMMTDTPMRIGTTAVKNNATVGSRPVAFSTDSARVDSAVTPSVANRRAPMEIPTIGPM